MFKVLKCLKYLASEHFKHIAVSISAQKLLQFQSAFGNKFGCFDGILEIFQE
jgi:hypothetical protein